MTGAAVLCASLSLLVLPAWFVYVAGVHARKFVVVNCALAVNIYGLHQSREILVAQDNAKVLQSLPKLGIRYHTVMIRVKVPKHAGESA